jgi:hypothetical protein
LLNFGKDFPYNTFLWLPDHKYTDFSSNWEALRNPDISKETIYVIFDFLPLWNLTHFAFSRIPNFEIAKFIYLSGTIFISYNLIYKFVVKFFKLETSLIINVIILLSYPVLFVFDRGNIEFLAFGLLFAFVTTSEKRIYLKVLLFTASCLIKPWPLILLPILIYKYRSKFLITFTTFYLGSLIIVPFILSAYLVGSPKNIFNFHKLIQMYSGYSDFMIFDRGGLAFSHSLYNIVSIIVNEFGITFSDSLIFFSYAVICFTLLNFLHLDYFKFKYPTWKFYAMMIILMDLLPFVSADYKLLNIYIVLHLLLRNSTREKGEDTLLLYSIAVLLIPKNIFIFGYTLGSVVNPIILSFMLLLIFSSRNSTKILN